MSCQHCRNPLAQLRKRNGIEQKHAALELGMSQASFSRLENGKTKLSLEHALKLSDFYRETLNEIIWCAMEAGIIPNMEVQYD